MSFLTRALLGLFLMLFAIVPAPAQESPAPDAGKARLQGLYMGYLEQEGYKPSLDKDGDVNFKREGKTYFIPVSERDSMFFSIVLPNFWPIESDSERAQVLAAADSANNTAKVTKVYTMGQLSKRNVWASIELFVGSPDQFKPVFQRCLEALDNGVGIFIRAMRGQ